MEAMQQKFKILCLHSDLPLRRAVTPVFTYWAPFTISLVKLLKFVLAGWLLAPSLTAADHLALQATAEVLGMRSGSKKDWSEAGLKVVTDYLDEQYAAIFAEAQRLESMRATLKSVDSQRTSQLLASVGIEDPSPVDNALSSLPTELVSVVEKVDDYRVEMLFPLTHLTQLQRLGFGIDKAQSLCMHFRVGDDGIAPRFCLHWDSEMKGKHKIGHDAVHRYLWIPGGNEPHLPICQGQISPAKYHLARALSRYLIEGFKSQEAVHVLLTTALKDLGRSYHLRMGPRHTIEMSHHLSSTIVYQDLPPSVPGSLSISDSTRSRHCRCSPVNGLLSSIKPETRTPPKLSL